MSAPVEIVAIGARTPVGLTAETSAAAVRAGISRLREFPFAAQNGEPVVVAADATLSHTLEGRERILLLIEDVLEQIARMLAQGEAHRGKSYLALALPEARPGFTDDDASWVAESVRARLRESGLEIQVEVPGRGHAGGIRAIELISQECARNPHELFLAVGAESYHHPDTFLWLERNRQFAQPGVRSGFYPGEGAACLALAGAELRARLRLPCLAIVRGVSTAQETRLRGSETGSFGVGMTSATRAATAALEMPREAVDTLYIDINGERYRSEEWGFVAMRAAEVFRSLRYKAPADCWGDVGAAWTTLASILAVQSYVRGYARGPRSLVLAGSESGLRGAMLLQAPVNMIGGRR